MNKDDLCIKKCIRTTKIRAKYSKLNTYIMYIYTTHSN